jgi:hypothetical protein
MSGTKEHQDEPGDMFVDRQGDRWEFNGTLYICEFFGSQPTRPPGLHFLWNEYDEEDKN